MSVREHRLCIELTLSTLVSRECVAVRVETFALDFMSVVLAFVSTAVGLFL